MSKLKAILATPHPKMKNACDGAIEVYPKDKADKVIADLEFKLAAAQQVLRLNQPRALFSDLETMGRLRSELDELRRKYELALATIKEYKNDVANLKEKLYEAQHDTNNCNMA